MAEHYLRDELYRKVRDDDEIFEFLQAGSLDGIWYWDLEEPENEWLSPQFKGLFGYEDEEVPNTSEWWQENIHPEDLPLVLETFQSHLETGSAYDQIVRYRHKDGSTVWVRCRGLAIRDENGKPIRMLGAHTDVTELKRIEQGVRKSEARYRNLVENTSDWIWEMGLDGKHTYTNHGVVSILGYSVDEFQRLSLDQLIHPEDMNSVQARLPSLIAEKRGWEGWVLRFRHEDGSFRYLESNAHPVLDAAGATCGFRGVDRDITSRKEAAERLRLSEIRLNEAQRMARIGSWERDLATDELWWSAERYRIVGRAPETFSPTHETVLETVHPDDRQHYLRTINNARATGTAYTIEYRVVLPTGSVRTLRSHGEVFFDETGRPVRTAGTAQDLTELKEVEERLRESVERYELAVSGSNDGIWDWNIRTGEDFFSPRWKGILGYRDEELTPSVDTFTDLLHPDDRHRAWKAVKLHLADKTPYDLEVRMRHKSGKYIWVRARGQATWDDAGEPLRMAGSIGDITAQREAEQEVIAVGERERQRVGHDLHDGLGQELTGISLSLSNLARNLARDKSPHEQAARSLTGMVQKTIVETQRVARLLSPGFSSEVGLSAALRALAAEVHEHSGVSCRAQCSDKDDIQDEEIAMHLFRIAQESINNALKHSGAQNIGLRYGRGEDSLFLEVFDDGTGVPPEGSRVEGVGLRSMRYRARMLNGRLEVAPGTPDGTRVRISCPLQSG